MPPDPRGLEALRRWARIFDSAFRIPGTQISFGLDPILGLVPGLGDVASPVFSLFFVWHGVRLGVPKVVLARMVLNVADRLGRRRDSGRRAICSISAGRRTRGTSRCSSGTRCRAGAPTSRRLPVRHRCAALVLIVTVALVPILLLFAARRLAAAALFAQ